MVTRKNPRGLVLELVLPPRDGSPDPQPRALRQLVIFEGCILERLTTNAQRSKHWRWAEYGEDNLGALAVHDPTSWLGKWIQKHAEEGFVLYGEPFLVEANVAEIGEIAGPGDGVEGKMPRALSLRLDKARTEVGAVKNPWTGE